MGLDNGGRRKSVLKVPGTKSSNSYPFSDKPFRVRVDECWKKFVKEEAVLRQLIDSKADREQISSELNKLLSPAFERTYAEVGRKGDKYDLILSLEGSWAYLFSRAYFKNRAPKEVLEHWNIYVGRQADENAVENFRIMLGEDSVSASDISLWTEWGKGFADLYVYCENMLPLINGNKNAAYQLLYILLDQAVGELAEMKFIRDIKFLDEPLAKPAMGLQGLLDDMVSNLSMTREQLSDAERYINLFSVYHIDPDPKSIDGTRGDIVSGSTCYFSLMDSYYIDRSYAMDSLEEDGIFGGFLFYPIDNVDCDSRGTAILDIRDAIKAELEEALPDSFMFIGGATGVNFGYIDFIAWDLREVLAKVPAITEKQGLSWVSFRDYRKGSESYLI